MKHAHCCGLTTFIHLLLSYYIYLFYWECIPSVQTHYLPNKNTMGCNRIQTPQYLFIIQWIQVKVFVFFFYLAACANCKSTGHWGPVRLHWQVQHWVGSTVQWHSRTVKHCSCLNVWTYRLANEYLTLTPSSLFVLQTLPQKVGEVCAQREPAPGQHRGARLPGQTAALWPSSSPHSQRGHGSSLLL